MNTVDVICPLYNAEGFIEQLNTSLSGQENIHLNIKYILTESSDKTEDFLISHHLNYDKISKAEFSHSLTREKYILASESHYVILITQDIIPEGKDAFAKLLEFTEKNHLAGAYMRQKSTAFLDRYFRSISYPEESHVYGKKELEELGRDAIFFSDTCSCIDAALFRKVNGYDHKNLNTNEDMYYSRKMLSMDYKMGYYADSCVLHSHKITLKKTYKRYVEIGYFMESNPEISSLKGKDSKYLGILKLAFKRFDLASIFVLPFNVMARLFGIKKGKRKYHTEQNKKK